MLKKDFIYLDNAATTFPKPEGVTKAVTDCLSNYAANPGRGRNPLVKRANEQLELTRLTLARFLGAKPEQLIFVPSATYAINIVMQGISLIYGDTLYMSPFEHNAVVRCADHLNKSHSVRVETLPLAKDGTFDEEETRRWFASAPPKLVVITHASNVTGDILPIQDIINLTHEYGGKVLIDAAQTVGIHTPLLDGCNYDFLAFSSHKGLYGMPGSGGLVIKDHTEVLQPLIYGGTGINSEDVLMPLALPERFESGTHSLPSIISMLAGVQWLEATGLDIVRTRVSKLTQQLLNGLSSLNISVVGHDSIHGNTGVVSFIISDVGPQEINALLDEYGFCIRSGLHCAPFAHQRLGTFPNGTVRISPAYFNTEDDINSLLNAVEGLCI
ncbi:MAG: aminotransferase class V-fold PLP-dependent enzyme [Clostridiales bacterium]|nr:aminotransferase class V-fold PLP-dependent enzyme [Clostridiales bacterium]